MHETNLYTKYDIKLECVGKVDKIVEFVYHIGSWREPVKIIELEFSAAPKEPEIVKCNLTVSKMVISMSSES